MVRRTRFSVITAVGVLTVFLMGCLVGAALQSFGNVTAHAQAAAVEAVPVKAATPQFVEPLNKKIVRSIQIRPEGYLVPADSDASKAN